MRVIDCGSVHVRRVRLLPDGKLEGAPIVTRIFYIHPDGKATGAFVISDWRPLTWTKNHGKFWEDDKEEAEEAERLRLRRLRSGIRMLDLGP